MAELTYDNLVKHLDRHGPDQVMETARDFGFTLDELVRLQTMIDNLPSRRRKVRHRKSVEARVRAFLGLPEEETTE